MAKCQALADWSGYAARRAASEAAGKCRGRGISYYVDNTGIFTSAWNCASTPTAN